jgi:hypothetical protein
VGRDALFSLDGRSIEGAHGSLFGGAPRTVVFVLLPCLDLGMIFRIVVWFPTVTSYMRSLRQSKNNLFQQSSLRRGDGGLSCPIKRELIEGKKHDEVSHWYLDHGRLPTRNGRTGRWPCLTAPGRGRWLCFDSCSVMYLFRPHRLGVFCHQRLRETSMETWTEAIIDGACR